MKKHLQISLGNRSGKVRLHLPFGQTLAVTRPASVGPLSDDQMAKLTAKLAAKESLSADDFVDAGLTFDQINPLDSDFIYPQFRALSATLIPGYFLDFTKPGMLEAAAPLLQGQTVYTDHVYWRVANWIGAVNQSTWDAKGDQVGGVPGINVELKIDWKMNPKIARGLLMKPPAIHSVSATVDFEWDASHPDLLEQGIFFRNLGQDIDGEIVRILVTKIVAFYELSLVFQGANPESNEHLPWGEEDESGDTEMAVAGDPESLISFVASGATDWPLSDRGASWDAGAAETRLRKWASHDGSGTKEKMNWPKYGRAHFWHESTKALNFGSYKLPFCDIVNGKVVAIWPGVTACAAVMQGSRGGVQIPDADRGGVKSRIEKYYTKARKQYGDDKIQVPWKKSGSQSQSADDTDKETKKVKLTLEQKKALGLEAQTGDEVEDSVVLAAVDALSTRVTSAEAKATAAQAVIDAERTEVVRLATISEGVTGEDKQVALPPVLAEIITKADPSQLPGLKILYAQRVDEKFKAKCAKCGSTEVSRRSSVEEAARTQDAVPPPVRASSLL